MATYAASAKDIPQYTHITTNTTTTIKSGNDAILYAVNVNTKGAASNTITVKDGNSNTIAVIDSTANVVSYYFGCICPQGLSVVTATGTAADITIVWS